MTVADAVRAALPDAFVEPAERGPNAEEDICRYDLGRAAAWVRPSSAAQVARVISVAREIGARVAVSGARTAYWRPLSFEGAVVLDTSRLDAIGDVRDGVVEVGAGAAVRAVADTLDAAGAALIAHPDAYGDSTLGAMVSSAFASGVGMGRATIDDLVAGLEVVLGTGEVIQTGASRALGHAGFARLGLPDPTGLFVGAQGSLGVVTAVALRAPPRRLRAALEWRAEGAGPSLRAAVALARDLRERGAYDTFRVEAKSSGGAPELLATLILDSPFSEAELAARLESTRERVGARFAGASIKTIHDPPRWWGPPEAHAEQMRAGLFRGVDVIVGYPEAEAAVDAAGQLFEKARGDDGLASMRIALYFAPRYVNLGVHTQWAEPAVENADRLLEHGVARLTQLGSVPYRWGPHWRKSHLPSLHPGYAALMGDLKARLDPDEVFGPGLFA